MVEISVVIPCYRCDASLKELSARLREVLLELGTSYEIILVNDGSPARDWEVIQEIVQEDEHVLGINLSRNFGQHFAITAGIDFCSGQWLVVMDGDLQDLPEEIPKLYAYAQGGYDAVVGIRKERKDTFFKKVSSWSFYLVYNYLSGAHIKNSIGNYGIYSRKVVEAVKSMREHNRSFGLFVLWAGFKRIEVEIEHAARKAGMSSYTFYKMMSLAFDSIVAHSNKLLKITVLSGFTIALLSFLVVLSMVLLRLSGWAAVPGWMSGVASTYLMGGMVICAIGVVGIYVGKVFDEVKGRPLYLVAEIIGGQKGVESP